MTNPQPGDRILIFKEPWLSMILDRRKRMDIRSRPLTGQYFLGYKKRIFGVMTMGDPQHIRDSAQFRRLRRLHRVSGSLPYKKTFGLPISDVRVINPPIVFKHPRGAISIVRFRG